MQRNARTKTAEKLRQRFQWLQSFTDEELHQISMCAIDEPLRAGEEYFDLSHPEQDLIPGRSGERVPEGACYVARSTLPEQVWRKLLETRPR
ncbi:MAG: hypothetical protein HY690_19180 [Chloroflexi bacterium]|nr:hypothetical protein [Chloroflexota bacterium]